jgi:hypothetical protein
MMPRFYFHLMSKEGRIPDDRGKSFDSLNEAHEHGQKLIDKILFHVGHDDTLEWKVVVSNDEDDAQLIIPFAVSFKPDANGEGSRPGHGLSLIPGGGRK